MTRRHKPGDSPDADRCTTLLVPGRPDVHFHVRGQGELTPEATEALRHIAKAALTRMEAEPPGTAPDGRQHTALYCYGYVRVLLDDAATALSYARIATRARERDASWLKAADCFVQALAWRDAARAARRRETRP